MPAPESDLALLIRAARGAGDIANRHFRDDPKVWDKPGNAGPVTEADLEVDAYLGDLLQTQRPDYGWLSEETEDGSARLETSNVFVIDPIDGTRAFIEGSRDWCHSLAVVEDGIAVAAAVYLPQHDLMYSAEAGSGAWCNGRPLQASPRSNADGSSVLGARPNFHADLWHDPMPKLDRTFRSSLAYRLCLVAEGQSDAMITLRPTWFWDIAAGTLIVQEAGGTVTDRNGHTLRFEGALPQTNGVLAGGAVHPALAAALRPAPPLPAA